MSDILQNYKLWLASIAVFLTLYAYIPYLKGILKGKTKPHLFTWLVWSIASFIAVFIQVVEGGGMGAWPTIVAVLTCFFITILSIWWGSKNIHKSDYVFLLLSLATIPLWVITESPVYSAVLITFIEVVAALPTVKKSWHNPEEEVFSTYAINTLRFLLSIFALEAYSISTMAYPLGMVFMNGLVAFILIIRSNHKVGK